jgi:hypothetical protein
VVLSHSHARMALMLCGCCVGCTRLRLEINLSRQLIALLHDGAVASILAHVRCSNTSHVDLRLLCDCVDGLEMGVFLSFLLVCVSRSLRHSLISVGHILAIVSSTLIVTQVLHARNGFRATL